MKQEMTWNNIPADQSTERFERKQTAALPPSSEVSLICAAQRGKISAFNQLVLAYQDSMYAWVASVVRDEALAEDITQLTFISAYKNLPTFRGGSLRAWLFQIARNCSYDMLRYDKRHPSMRLDNNPQDEAEGGLISMLPANEPSPEEALIQSEQANWLRHLLNRLPEAFRQAA